MGDSVAASPDAGSAPTWRLTAAIVVCTAPCRARSRARSVLRRVPDPHNRRVIRIELRDGGRRALADLRLARRTAAAEILAPLDDGSRAALSALLAALDQDEAAEPRRC